MIRPGIALIVLGILLVGLAWCGFWIPAFRLDASADSLVLEHDEDLRVYRVLNQRYGSSEFLLLTYTPEGDLLGDASLAAIRSLRDGVRVLGLVARVTTLLDVPLFFNPPVPLKDLRGNIKTLEHEAVDKALAREELRTSPLYRDRLVSADMKTTILKIDLIQDAGLERMLDRRAELRDRRDAGTLGEAEALELEEVAEAAARRQEEIGEERHALIAAIRELMAPHRASARLFLGGVPMIADDMISFIKRDLRTFGLGMCGLLVLTLGLIFRRFRWVLLPMFCCIFSVTVMMGLLGYFGWPVTVISSNFISLQLILTMALAIHLVVRYTELIRQNPEASNLDLIVGTVRSKFVPCLFTTLTTMAGFGSLVLCDILPVINFGWMMTMGLVVSMVVTFLLFPATLALLPKVRARGEVEFGSVMTGFLARLTQNHRGLVLLGTLVVAVLTGVGISRLRVENSFIDYFRASTEIHQGMKVIDEELGGTTPLEVIIDFEEAAADAGAGAAGDGEPTEDDDFFDDFEEEETEEDRARYWFTTGRLEVVRKVHDYLYGLPEVGNVLSLDSLVKVADGVVGDEPWDNLGLALLFRSSLSEDEKAEIVRPFVCIEKNQVHINARIKDSLKDLKRDELLRTIRHDLDTRFGLKPGQARVAGLMVLYNNMLQSLFDSQIKTLGFTALALWVMILILFRSLSISLIAMFPNLLASLVVLGVMGLLDLPLDMMTITIVAICIGIAIDNTIHYVHRFRSEIQVDGDAWAAMHRCHGSIGNALFYTSITIITGFSILAFSNFIPSVVFGLLTGLAMAVAVVGSLTLLPLLLVIFKPFGGKS